jgi:hypothetical protein
VGNKIPHADQKTDEDWPTALEAEDDVRVSMAAEVEEPAPTALWIGF